MMQAVEKRFGSNGKPPKAIEWLTDNGSYYQVFDAKFDCAGHRCDAGGCALCTTIAVTERKVSSTI